MFLKDIILHKCTLCGSVLWQWKCYKRFAECTMKCIFIYIGCGDHESHWIPGTQTYTNTAILINSPDGWRFFSCTNCKMKTNPQIKDYTCTCAFMRIKCNTPLLLLQVLRTRSVRVLIRLESLNNRLIIQTYMYMDYVQNYKYYMYPHNSESFWTIC